jgi:hypothetical protein
MKLPQLSLRELFLLVVIAAMGCGWWVERSVLLRQQRQLIRDNMLYRQEDRLLRQK